MNAWLGAGKEKNSKICRGKIFLPTEFFFKEQPGK